MSISEHRIHLLRVKYQFLQPKFYIFNTLSFLYSTQTLRLNKTTLKKLVLTGNLHTVYKGNPERLRSKYRQFTDGILLYYIFNCTYIWYWLTERLKRPSWVKIHERKTKNVIVTPSLYTNYISLDCQETRFVLVNHVNLKSVIRTYYDPNQLTLK